MSDRVFLDWHESGPGKIEKGCYDSSSAQFVLGIMFEASKKLLLVGEFKNGKLNGLGRKYSLDAHHFVEGLFKNNQKMVNELYLEYEHNANGALLSVHLH